MAYRLLYGTGVISGIGERSDHSTVSVELASSHVPWDVFSSTIVYLLLAILGGNHVIEKKVTQKKTCHRKILVTR